jgi:uncharacterized protein
MHAIYRILRLGILGFSLVFFLGSSFVLPLGAQDNSLLWSVYREDLKDTSFLFGTIHLIPAADFFVPSGLERVLNRCEGVYFEIDLQGEMTLEQQISLLPKLRMKEGLTLEDLYSSEEYLEIQNFFKDKGLPFFLFNGMKPMFVQMMVQLDMESFLGDAGEQGMKSYELYLSSQAKMADLPISGLETIDFQIGIFDSIPYAQQALMLLETIKTLKSGSTAQDADMDNLYALYKSQDLDKIQEMMNESEDPIAREYADLFLYKRNENWIPILEEAMAHKPLLFAVGAAHLPGEKGVIQLLRDKGYQVLPLAK